MQVYKNLEIYRKMMKIDVPRQHKNKLRRTYRTKTKDKRPNWQKNLIDFIVEYAKNTN